MIILKPDAFERRLVGCILRYFEPNIIRMYTGRMHKDHCNVHYADHIGKPYYMALVHQMISGISLFVDVGPEWYIARGVALTVRENYGVEGPRNLIHASDSQEANERETAYWFKGYPNDSGICRREVLPQSVNFGQELGCSVERAILQGKDGKLENSP